MDDGGTANGGIDTSAAQTFTITVTAVNDAPSFIKGVIKPCWKMPARKRLPMGHGNVGGPADES